MQIWVTGAILIPVINQRWINSNHNLADNIVATWKKLKKSLQNHENESIWTAAIQIMRNCKKALSQLSAKEFVIAES